MTQPLTQIVETSAAFWLRVVIEPYVAPISTHLLNVRDALLIGRDPGAGVLLHGELVSRRHVLVRATHGGGLEIEDLSLHGTLVDGMPLLRARLRVAHECTLQVGCVRLRLHRLHAPEVSSASGELRRNLQSRRRSSGRALR
jgi:pSer/pThr/pTyr-binding forkhead associated (FHA) protein